MEPETIPETPSPTPSSSPRLSAFRLRPGEIPPPIKLGLIALLTVVMLVPMSLVSGLVRDRQLRQEGVLKEFKTSWGPEQTFAGPVLIVPYQIPRTGMTGDRAYDRGFLHIAPTQLSVRVQLSPETRARGLFRAVVFSALVTAQGSFTVPNEIPLPQDAEVLWHAAVVALRASDLRTLRSSATIRWGDRMLPWTSCAQRAEIGCGNTPFVVARLMPGEVRPAEPIAFETRLELRGTEAFWLTPLGREVDLAIVSAWPTPSFGGAALPELSTVSDQGFDASWHVSSNVATGPWLWTSNQPFRIDYGAGAGGAAQREIGVQLLERVPTYRQVERSSKYDVLFLALAFLTYFLFEMIARVRIHVIQYGLMGLSLTLFTLLLISFSEPLGFAAGYAIGAALVLVQASIYTAVTSGRRQGSMFAGVLTAMFGFVYVLLSLESYSLMVGAVALFVALSLVMAVTRRIDWSGRPSAVPPATAA